MEGLPLQAEMEILRRQQRICILVQSVFFAASILWFYYGVYIMPTHILIAFFFGRHLANRALKLAGEKYRDVPVPVSIQGTGTMPYGALLIPEAKRQHDKLTLKLLRFFYISLGLAVGGTLGNIGMWVLLAYLNKHI